MVTPVGEQSTHGADISQSFITSLATSPSCVPDAWGVHVYNRGHWNSRPVMISP